jgi:hypothetical protein
MDSPCRRETSFVVRIGTDLFPVRGSAQAGWNMAAPGEGTSQSCWYASLDELVFVLINLSIATDGSA